jgi:hypothetical protein
VNRTAALVLLPAPYGLALQMRDEGADLGTIATATNQPVDAIQALLEVGERKLATLLAEDAGSAIEH